MTPTRILAAATAAALLGIAGVSIAGAVPDRHASRASVVAEHGGGTAGRAQHAGHRHRIRRLVRRAIGLSARTIGIERADLVTELRAGQTVGEVATAHGVEPQAVVDALVQAANTRIDKAEGVGRITETRAARLRERAPERANRFVTQWHPRRAGG